MFALSSTTEDCMNYVTEDVISEVRYDLVDSGKLEETVLRELQAVSRNTPLFCSSFRSSSISGGSGWEFRIRFLSTGLDFVQLLVRD